MRPELLSIIPIGGGLFSIAVAYFGWGRFMTASNAKPVVDLFGRKGARIVYGALGALLVTFGVLFAAGVLQLPPPEVHSS